MVFPPDPPERVGDLSQDGYWNGGAGVSGNDDIDEGGPFDGGRYEDDVRATLGDTAMYYYETDLWPGLEDRVPVSGRDIAGAPPGTLDEDQPVMHQHMKTYSIAFGVVGTIEESDLPSDPATPFTWPMAGASSHIPSPEEKAARL